MENDDAGRDGNSWQDKNAMKQGKRVCTRIGNGEREDEKTRQRAETSLVTEDTYLHSSCR